MKWLLVLACACGSRAPDPDKPAPSPPAAGLRAPADFASIADRAERSRAIFGEVSRVLLHPRCVNCHPPDEAPRQGDQHLVHDPPAIRGETDQGVVGMQCQTCHQDRNLDHARVPGAPGWHLAPKSMAWLGKSSSEICAQLSDPARNGGRTLAQIQEHVAHDALVAWGWQPGADRVPAPGSQAQAGALVAAWIETGAVCP